METFQHEILTFDASRTKDFEAMKRTLNEWGAEGFAVASVAMPAINSNVFTVFLQREIPSDATMEAD